MRRALPLLALALNLLACGASSPIYIYPDATTSPGQDAGSPDTAAGTDALPGADAAISDAVISDAASAPDAGTPDGARADAIPEDALDATLPDALDAARPDAHDVDASIEDAAAPDAAGADAGPVLDPEQPGPYTPVSRTESFSVPATLHFVTLDCRLGDGAPRGPLVVIAPGYQIAPAQYLTYAEHLASFGYVACTAAYSVGLVTSHVDAAADLTGAVDELLALGADSTSPFFDRIDSSRIALVGHSLGGKLAVLAAAADARVKAIVGLDPVDAAPFCTQARCPDATDLLPLAIPIAVLGETLDATPVIGTQACAPADGSYATFYDAASSPALEVTVTGAGHMSFIGSRATCGLTCSACQTPTADQDQVLTLARSYLVSFLERHLRGNTAYQTYLTGALATQRYVTPGRATLRSK
ncbi:MAG: hypothetical protein IT384_21635 [Deltaproteobacteria bacterium]|nr:hypothetical protein [Deltaproteobacteria bacterium]